MVYRFTDVVIDSRTGLNPRKNFVLGGGDNYYITIKDIYNGKVNLTDKTDKVDDEAIQIIKRRSRIKVGDVLFVSIGRIGETAIVINKDDSWDVNESVFVFTLNDKIITPEYFCTMFQSQGVKQYLSGNSSGSTFKSIKMNQLERMTFDLTPVTTQKSITTKLTAVRRIIDLRTSQLAELDNLVKARFVEMFGDPDDNHMGWPKVTFEEISEIITDGEHATPRRSEKGIYLLSARNVLNHSLSFDDVDYIDQKEFDRISKRLIPQAGDVLISCSGTVGRVCTVPENLQFQLVRSVALVRFKKEINPVFMEYQISMPYIQKQIDASKSQTSQANLFQGKIKKLIAIVPSEELQIQFVKFVEQSNKSKAGNPAESGSTGDVTILFVVNQLRKKSR